MDDPDVVAALFEMIGDRRQADRVHLEGGRRKDDVADGPVLRAHLAEVVNARGMEQDQIDAEQAHAVMPRRAHRVYRSGRRMACFPALDW